MTTKVLIKHFHDLKRQNNYHSHFEDCLFSKNRIIHRKENMIILPKNKILTKERLDKSVKIHLIFIGV